MLLLRHFFPLRANPAIRGTRSAWNGIVTAAEHQDQRPINRAAWLSAKTKWEPTNGHFDGLRGFTESRRGPNLVGANRKYLSPTELL